MSTTPRFDKSRLPSRHVTEGPARAPHRSYYYAMGMTEEEIHQPLVGVATCWNEAAPCNIALNRQAQAVKPSSLTRQPCIEFSLFNLCLKIPHGCRHPNSR